MFIGCLYGYRPSVTPWYSRRWTAFCPRVSDVRPQSYRFTAVNCRGRRDCNLSRTIRTRKRSFKTSIGFLPWTKKKKKITSPTPTPDRRRKSYATTIDTSLFGGQTDGNLISLMRPRRVLSQRRFGSDYHRPRLPARKRTNVTKRMVDNSD